ncbi:MAG: hypothetical protein C4K60_13330 [Ideonella sp. MAG2]|nr:MAG: hypothetical protein C4K60_13330 [Ideonella sp. MAG2]
MTHARSLAKHWAGLLIAAGVAASPTAPAAPLCTQQWGNIEVLHPTPGQVADIKAGVDDMGRVHVAYVMVLNEGRREVLSVRMRTPDGVWQPPQVLYERKGEEPSFTTLSLAVGPSGHALLAWVGGYSRNPEVAAYTPDTGWGMPISLKLQGVGVAHGLVTQVNGSGTGIVAWRAQDVILSRHHTPASGWGEPQRFPTSNTGFGGDAPYLSLSQNEAGQAVLAWGEQAPKAVTFTPQAGWTAPATLKAIGRVDFRRTPEAAMDQAGNAFVTWSHSGSKSKSAKLKIWAARFNAAQGWQRAEPISQSERHAVQPDVAAHNGRAAVVWSGVVRTIQERAKFSLYDPALGWSPEGDTTPQPTPEAIGRPLVHLSSAGVLTVARFVKLSGDSLYTETSSRTWGSTLGKPVIEMHPMVPWDFAANSGAHQVLVDALDLGAPGDLSHWLPRARVGTVTCPAGAQR